MQRACDGTAMFLPDVAALKYSPGPSGPIVWLHAIHRPVPKRDYEVQDVEHSKMYDIRTG